MLAIHYVEAYINLIKNLNIIITGTSSGIGLALTQIFLKHGNKVWGCSRSKKKINNKNYFHSKVDLRSKKEIKHWIQKIEKQSNNKIDIFISNAAQFVRKLHSLDSIDTIEDTIKTNLITPMVISNMVSKIMIKNKIGLMIFFSSVAVELNQIGSSTYAASKAGIETFSKVVNNELKDLNIKVATIRILYIPTKLSDQLSKKEIKNLVKKFKTNLFNNINNLFKKIEEIYHSKRVLKKNVFFDIKKR